MAGSGLLPQTVASRVGARRPAPAPATYVPLERRLRALNARALVLQRASARFDQLLSCTSQMGVDQIGDVRHRWGLLYDERDGSGGDMRTALSPHRGAATPELRLLRLSRGDQCLSRPPDPNGSGANARPAAGRQVTLATLAAQLRLLERRVALIEGSTDRFDDWESCLSFLPVTEDGDARQKFGFKAGGQRLPAIDLDSTEWDDPDYQLLGFVGSNRPFGKVECQTEPGEASDRPISRAFAPGASASKRHVSSARSRPTPLQTLRDLRERTAEAQEDLEDLAEPVGDVTRFDECMYTVGVQSRGGYAYRDERGVASVQSALSFDLRSTEPAQWDLMAFPGEEPPAIECNEDAGGEDTEE